MKKRFIGVFVLFCFFLSIISLYSLSWEDFEKEYWQARKKETETGDSSDLKKLFLKPGVLDALKDGLGHVSAVWSKYAGQEGPLFSVDMIDHLVFYFPVEDFRAFMEYYMLDDETFEKKYPGKKRYRFDDDIKSFFDVFSGNLSSEGVSDKALKAKLLALGHGFEKYLGEDKTIEGLGAREVVQKQQEVMSFLFEHDPYYINALERFASALKELGLK